MHPSLSIWRVSQNKNLWIKNYDNGKWAVMGKSTYSRGYYVIKFDKNNEKHPAIQCESLEYGIHVAEKWLEGKEFDRKSVEHWYNVIVNKAVPV